MTIPLVSESRVKEKVRSALSDARFQHVSGVVEAADMLAKRYGADAFKARLAAWTHDYAREWLVEQWYEVGRERGVDEAFFEVAETLHGPIVATMLREEFNIYDEEIADAVRYHTTGRVEMTLLDKVVCLADYIEAGRHFPGVEELRTLAENDLDEALATAFDGTIRHLLDLHKPVFPLTLLARNDLWQKIKDKRKL
ncbi:bis(5'-nucleosyl)-tetraphosphatase (symmetrical) YqeK [Tumebacillus sp. ITR2]|uniref:bis(5'-nucleosyl)-tetraphosphatase (symmetrical) n=1 Tax=Tumebacillus amylolyticus TaxID=2801339 RepID=A0ABS1JAM7_9BACL|nr:bis(5'-nucleosyl)-tetraphosphatase (symmetrical) YqeK [Tumebacillus amylolyticus]MBL0387327.1 bis(5'-nucleosyl)-tetraphosphatase (symmetrical) YqeK [Tumebacillus amylolyticus]